MTKLIKIISVLLLGAMFVFNVQAGKPARGGNTTGAFTFTYNVGTVVTNYHAYGFACQVGWVNPQPAGTVVLGNWWVWDLGKVTGTGTITCPKLITPKGQTQTEPGILLFADARDVGGDGTQIYTHPVADIQIFNKNYYNGYASIEMIIPPYFEGQEPTYTGLSLYWGPPFTPFTWDLSPYIYN